MTVATIISSNQLHYSVEEGCPSQLAADASDLGFMPAETPREVIVKSDRTGRYVTFYLMGLTEDREGDVLAWYLRPVDDRDVNVTLIIHND